MLPLHEADTNKFKSSVLPNIEDQNEHTELLNKLKNFSGSKIHYHDQDDQAMDWSIGDEDSEDIDNNDEN